MTEVDNLLKSQKKSRIQLCFFDEIEKAHPDVFNILLQVLDDEWAYQTIQGRLVDFKMHYNYYDIKYRFNISFRRFDEKET